MNSDRTTIERPSHEPCVANPEPARELLTQLARQTLLTIYRPEQVDIWLAAHASGDPVEVAAKALRLCGGRAGEPTQPTTHEAQQAHEAHESPEHGQREQVRHEASELRTQQIITGAVRGMLGCEQRTEVLTLLLETVHRLGGRIVKASAADDDALPVDLSLGVGEPLLAVPDPDAPRSLQAQLPQLVEDARQTIARLQRSERMAAAAELDPLTGLLNRRGYERLEGRLGTGDVLILLDLDDFKAVNDTHGHLAGDQVLRLFGAVLRDEVRISEHAIRLGGDEFLVVLQDAGQDAGPRFLERLRLTWEQRRPLSVGFSAGVASVTSRVDRALEVADRSLYEQKDRRNGRGAADRPAISVSSTR